LIALPPQTGLSHSRWVDLGLGAEVPQSCEGDTQNVPPLRPVEVRVTGDFIVNRTPVIERAFELARSGRFRIPSEVRKALISDRYTQAELFQLEGKATWRQLRTICADSYYRT